MLDEKGTPLYKRWMSLFDINLISRKTRPYVARGTKREGEGDENGVMIDRSGFEPWLWSLCCVLGQDNQGVQTS